MEQFLRRLEKLGLGLSDEDIADMIWLAMQMGSPVTVETSTETETQERLQDTESRGSGSTSTVSTPSIAAPQRQAPVISAFASDSVSRPPEAEASKVGLPFQAPAMTALPNALDLGRSLRPLMRKVPSATQFEVDSEATVNRVIEQQMWQPVLVPAPERWLDLELVIEESPLSLIWQQTLDELKRKVLERSGAFRNVRSWTLRDQDGKPQLISRYAGEAGARTGQPQELVHPSGRCLVMVISDAQSELWQSSQLQSGWDTWQLEQPAPNLHAWLHYWARHGPMVMVQLLPKWMWEQSALEFGTPVRLMSIFPGTANEQWSVMGLSARHRRRVDDDSGLKMPVIILEADALETWANVVAAAGITPTPGFIFNLNDLRQYQQTAGETPSRLAEISDEALIDRFLATASPTAQQLAAMMAAVPVSVPVIHLLQANFLPQSTPVHVAEVFMSGLLHQTGTNEKTHQPIYDFKSKEVRRLLNQAYPDYKTHQVVSALSEAIARKLGREDLNSFAAFLSLNPEVLELGDNDQERIVQRFAELLPEVLRNLGGAYATLADTAELLARQPKLLETETTTETSDFPPEFPGIPALEDFDYLTPVVSFEDDREYGGENEIGLVSELVTVEVATITVAPSISEDEALNALEQELSEIKHRVIESFQEQDINFQIDKRPKDPRLEDVDESQISISYEKELSVEILNTDLEEIAGNVANFSLSAQIYFAVEVDYSNLDEYEDIPDEDSLWTGQSVDGSVQVRLIFSGENLSEVEIDDVELDLDDPVWVDAPARSTPEAADTDESPSPDTLEPFEIEIKTIEKVEGKWVTLTDTGTAYRYIEPLGEGVDLEMVAIPAGEFEMGSPEDEPGWDRSESPQHHVTVSSFFMGRYPVTQAQWRVVAGFPRVERDLEADPSGFKGDNRPVERVSWYDAMEFCARLSCHSGREYRLPSEAEWEYACRAGTTTPFHFGKMIKTEVANYNGNAYADGPKGERRRETTPVTEFSIANAFGLSDMHGNVLEWCLDHWHENYEGAPTDGSAWLSEDENAYRVRRGGSWYDGPWDCRSAYRYYNRPVYRLNTFGFRVVVAPRGTP